MLILLGIQGGRILLWSFCVFRGIFDKYVYVFQKGNMIVVYSYFNIRIFFKLIWRLVWMVFNFVLIFFFLKIEQVYIVGMRLVIYMVLFVRIVILYYKEEEESKWLKWWFVVLGNCDM